MAWGAVAPVLLVLAGMAWELRVAGGLASDGHIMRSTAALGSARSGMVLFALAALPWWLRGADGAVWVARVVGVAMLLLLNGVVPSWLGDRAAQLLNWRSFWAIPFTPLLGLAWAAGAVAAWEAWSRRSRAGWLRGCLALLLGVAFVLRGTWAVHGDGIVVAFASEKVLHKYERIADEVMRHVGPTDHVAAGPHVSQALAMRRRKPKLNAVWARYVVNLTRFWGREETDRRLRILQYVRAKAAGTPLDDLDQQCITVVVTLPRHAAGPSAGDLPERGFAQATTVNGHVLWTRPAASLPQACRPRLVRE